MSPLLRLVARIAEGGQKSQGSPDGAEYHHNDYRDSDDNSNMGNGLPWYAVLLIVYFSTLFLVFWSSLVYYWTREKERRRGSEPFRTGHIVWKAASVATGIAVWIWLFKQRRGYGSDRKNNGAAGVGPYKKIRNGQTPAAVGVSVPSPTPSGSVLATNPDTPLAWYGASASQTTTPAPYEQQNGMFKSPGYDPTHQDFAQHESIPMITLKPSPSESPSPSPSPSPSYAPPPPYISTPPPAALYGQNAQSKYPGPMY